MTAYIVVDLTPIDKEKMQDYSSLAGETLMKFKGEFIAKGPITGLHGNADFMNKVIIAFPDKETAQAWYMSAEYQKIIPLRDSGMDSTFHLIG